MRYVLTMLILIAFRSKAGLVWESTREELKAGPGQAHTEVEFICYNEGDKPVSLRYTRSSCGCTSASLKPGHPSVIEPNGRGRIQVRFDFGNREGIHRQWIEVAADDGALQILELKVEIPRTYSVVPKILRWTKADKQQSKTCRLVNVSSAGIELQSVRSSGAAFGVALKPVRPGFEYEVSVTPPGHASDVLRSVITVTSRPAEGQKPKTYRIYALLK